ncbi:MAG: cryptochrome/photolyase family protein [Betaproteobacteria bacterium]|jgi:deoxyribodipyrimidine photolyase-related protein
MAGDVALILGNQLSLGNAALGTPASRPSHVLMVEAPGEATHVPSHKARIALFLSAMRHFATTLADQGFPVHYIHLDDMPEAGLRDRLSSALARLSVRTLVVTEPGDFRVGLDIQEACAAAGVALRILPDSHFLISRADFEAWAGDRKSLRMETFYRHMRRRTGVLMEGAEPAGGIWNLDTENRSGFGAHGPPDIPAPPHFPPDAQTREVLEVVERRFPRHPGRLDSFGWPVTRAEALIALGRFIEDRLEHFGPHQDAMWTGHPHLWHAILSSSLNLGLLSPAEVIEAATNAFSARRLPLASVEGFVRQILGWREFIRGVYWRFMPELAQVNHFGHQRHLPAWYWTGNTAMNCMRETIGQTLNLGYAHHIQRLMVTGNFALLAEVQPQEVSDWYLAVYVDAVEWVELPNTVGMALFADGGRFTSKPYVASGAYTKRMSNYCRNCRYDPSTRSGERACPVTLLYWAFLDKHEDELARNPRTSLMASNIRRLSAEDRHRVRQEADALLDRVDQI